MKKVLLISMLLTAWQAYGQHETLFDDFDTFGAFGGPLLEIGAVNGEVGADVGGGGAIILENFFMGGYGLGTAYPELALMEEVGGEMEENFYDIRFKHGGLWFGYSVNTKKAVHFYSSMRLGWGRVQLENGPFEKPSDRIFVATPELGIELNLTGFFKIAFTGGYRLVSGVSRTPGLDDDDFSSPVGAITFRFGGFGDNWEWD